MKKKITIVAVLAIILAALLSACKPPVPGDATLLYTPSEMEVVRGLDAYDVIIEAHKTWQKADKYSMTIDFDFEITNLAYQSSHQHVIKNGSEFYDFYMVCGTGAGETFKSHKFYTDGKGDVDAIYIRDKVNDGKKRVWLDDNKLVKSNYKDLTWGGFDSLQEADDVKEPIDRVNKLTKSLYSYYDAEKFISPDMDRQVYKKDNKFYCTMMINTLDMQEDSEIWQDKVVAAIEKATGGKFKQFNADTRFVCELEKVDGIFRFTQFILMEDYAGVQAGILTVDASQKYWHKFAYDDASTTITEKGDGIK